MIFNAGSVLGAYSGPIIEKVFEILFLFFFILIYMSDENY